MHIPKERGEAQKLYALVGLFVVALVVAGCTREALPPSDAESAQTSTTTEEVVETDTLEDNTMEEDKDSAMQQGDAMEPDTSEVSEVSDNSVLEPIQHPDGTPLVEINVTMIERNNSSQAGVAKLTDIGGATEVNVTLNPVMPSVDQPVNIHKGSCANLGTLKHTMNYLRGGTSQTVLTVSPGTIVDDLPLAIVVTKSVREFNNYVACGDIRI